MIASVALASDVVLDDLGDGPAVIARVHTEFVRMLLEHGELIHADAADRDCLILNVLQLMQRAPDAGKAWETALKDGRWGVAPSTPTPIAHIDDIETFRQQWGQTIDVAFMERVRAECLGCPEDALAWRDPESGIEIASCVDGWQTSTFKGLRELSDEHTVQPGTYRDDLAQARWVPFLERAKYIAVFDRWIGKNVSRQYRRDQHVARRKDGQGTPELAWLLRLVDEHAHNARLAIFTTHKDGPADDAFPRPVVVEAVADLWARIRSRGGLGELKLFVAPDKAESGGETVRFPHDRHIRFDEAGFSLTAGFDRVRFEQTRKGDTWRLFYLWHPNDVRGLHEDEDVVRRIAGVPEIWT